MASERTTIEVDGGTTAVSLVNLTTSIEIPSMSDALELTAGDTHIPLRARLIDPDGEPADLENIRRVTFRMIDRTGMPVVDARATVDDETDEQGWVRYEWSRGETADPGTYRARFRVEYSDGKPLHYPNGRPVKILIRQP